MIDAYEVARAIADTADGKTPILVRGEGKEREIAVIMPMIV